MKYVISKDGKSIKCLNCGMTSYNPIDVRDKYCGNCHVFLEDNELMKNLDPHFDKAIPTEQDCKRIKAHETYYRKRLDKVMGKHLLKLFKIVCGEKNG